MCRPLTWASRVVRKCRMVAGLLPVIGTAACDSILDVEYPGRIPTEQIDDPVLASVLVLSIIGDFECAYNNYTLAGAIHSDEMEGTLSNFNVVVWSHRGISADNVDYVSGPCEGAFGAGGLHVPMQTARFMSEFVYDKLNNWTDEQVANRGQLMATARAYGAYTYTFFGETYCSIAFDKGPEVQPEDALAIAEQRFAEAISLAEASGATDILNLARVGMARVKMDLEKWSEAATFAAQVPPGFEKFADRGTENDRRYNKIHAAVDQGGFYTVAIPYRTMNDPRTGVVDSGHDSSLPGARLWTTTKSATLGSPIRLASYEEARLILAEAQAQQGQVQEAELTVNAYRASYNLPPLSFANQADAITKIIEERRRELSFEGGHRLNDLLRYDIPWKVGVSPVDANPYGQTTCWPFPSQEASGV